MALLWKHIDLSVLQLTAFASEGRCSIKMIATITADALRNFSNTTADHSNNINKRLDKRLDFLQGVLEDYKQVFASTI